MRSTFKHVIPRPFVVMDGSKPVSDHENYTSAVCAAANIVAARAKTSHEELFDLLNSDDDCEMLRGLKLWNEMTGQYVTVSRARYF